MFPLADARGRVVGFQARKLAEDDPLRGKYVNSPEGDLFKKGAILYGLHLARTAIAKQGRAAVVEGNTDVIALAPGGLRAGRRVDGDRAHRAPARGARPPHPQGLPLLRRRRRRAGGDAPWHGARHRQGFDAKVVTLPRGQDPADAPDGFEDKLEGAESYLLYRVRLELDRAADRQGGFVHAREVLARAEDSPERQEAVRLLADRLDLPKETLAGLAPARGAPRGRSRDPASARGGRPPGTRDARRLRRAPVPRARARRARARAFRLRGHRLFRAALVSGKDDGLTSLRAELDARASREAIDERTGRSSCSGSGNGS